MKTINQHRAFTTIKWLIALPVLAILTVALYSCGKNTTSSENLKVIAPPPPPPPPPPPVQEAMKVGPYDVVEEMPQFPGGDAALLKYIGENTIYPASAKTQNIQGRVIVKFAIATDGSVSMTSVLKGVDPDLDNEALRVVKSLPKFKPGKQGGIVVPVWYMIPISFTLK